MLQKCYMFEIVNLLTHSELHVRALAKALNTNQTTIARKVKELERMNVVDYKYEGKNKIYFLKKSIEAYKFVLMGENYKMLKLINYYPALRIIFDEIIKDKRIKLAILFGSYAKDRATKTSDVDIFIETKNKKIRDELEKLNSKLSIKIGKFGGSNPLINEIKKNHVIIKGVEIYYERVGFFEKS